MFKNLKIGKKLILSFAAIVILASVSSVVSILTMRNMENKYHNALVQYGFSQGDIGKAMLMVTDSRRAVRDVVNMSRKENVEAAKQQLTTIREGYNVYAKKVEAGLVTAQEKQVYQEIQTALAEYEGLQNKYIELSVTASNAGKAQLQQMMLDDLDPIYQKLYDSYSGLMEIKVNEGNRIADLLSGVTLMSVLMNVVLLIAAAAIAITLGCLIARSISKPIHLCVNRLKALSQGDLQSAVPQINAKDETGVLADATATIVDTMKAIINDESYLLGEMANGNFDLKTAIEDKYVGDFGDILKAMRKINGSLNGTLAQINESANQVASGSDQVSCGAQSLSQGATEQASSIEQLSATITEVTSQIIENAQSAKKAGNESVAAVSYLIESNNQMKAMMEAMNNINMKSGEISKIIKTIDDIAFQTNILALNAAVEAARAGSAGKGFAVVADEVRNLAGKSAEAAQNTTTLIEDTINAVSQGSSIADNAAKSLEIVIERAKLATELMENIAVTAHEQADAMHQVTAGVDQISNVVQTNSATAEESAAASEELSGQAQILKDLVNKFKFRQEDTADSVYSKTAADVFM